MSSKSLISYCRTCNIRYYPKEINKRGNKLFGHAFQSWIVYQRLVLRLSYQNIVKLMEEQFNEKVSLTTVTECIKSFASNYSDTENIILQHILDSPFIHVDETTISIRGVDQYVWVFTTNKHVIFKLTKTREANIVHELLANYNGILVSDFYAGYDSDKFYKSQLVMKYQKRFIRYQQKLFIFMEEDGIAWHNNRAESAIRHFTKQRDISGSFFESFTHSYLTMLGITQTCKFQGKSLLKFLLSGEKDIDTFKQKRNIKNSKIVGLHKNN